MGFLYWCSLKGTQGLGVDVTHGIWFEPLDGRGTSNLLQVTNRLYGFDWLDFEIYLSNGVIHKRTMQDALEHLSSA